MAKPPLIVWTIVTAIAMLAVVAVVRYSSDSPSDESLAPTLPDVSNGREATNNHETDGVVASSEVANWSPPTFGLTGDKSTTRRATGGIAKYSVHKLRGS